MTQLGKYSTDRDNILHYMATSDWANDSFGNVEAPTGYVWRISNDAAEVQVSNTELTSLIEDQLKVYSIEDGPEFRSSLAGHFLIAEDSNGFVSVSEYPTAELLQQAYDSLEGIYSEWVGQDDE
jgi:hypothetical protein